MINSRLLLTLLALSLFSFNVQAQSKIKGAVIDYQSKEGIPDCHVYISGTKKGGFTNAKGYFQLNAIPDGIYELVFSHVGYQSHVQLIEVKGQDITVKAQLAMNTTALSTVVVNSRKAEQRRKRALKRFKEFFFGEQYKEQLISIKNEDIIDLSKTSNGMIISERPYVLEVENDYLGYNLEYYVKNFQIANTRSMVLGFPGFSEQTPKNKLQELRWAQNRQKAYNGSLRHFLDALLNNRLEEEKFRLVLSKRDPEKPAPSGSETGYSMAIEEDLYVLNKQNLYKNIEVKDTYFDNIKEVSFPDVLEVYYFGEFGKRTDFQVSIMKMDEPSAYVYTNGILVTPSAFKLFGQWAGEGAYELLPYSYESNDSLVLDDNINRQEKLTALNLWTEKYPVEKVYLHTNRSDYYPNETIWFKAYTAAGPDHQPSPLSNNIYVELIGPDKSIIKQLLLASDEGFADGSIELDKRLKAGNYILQAHTENMKGDSSGYYFRKEIQINSINGNTKPILTSAEVDLQLFPEGGDLISQVSSNVAFKAIDTNGLPTKVTGAVYGISAGDTTMVTRIATQHDGMGSFSLTPEDNTLYFAKTDQSPKYYPLPEVATSGISLSIDHLSDKDYVHVTLTKNEKTKEEEYFLIGHTRGWLHYTAAADFDAGQKVILKMYKKDIKEGINHLTVFDKQGMPMAERFFYHRVTNGLNVSLTPQKDTYQTRDMTHIKIKVTDKEGLPVEGNFSLTAFNKNRVYKPEANDNIVSNLLLNSDLKGYIHHPAYYFQNVSATKDNHLDLVMMTNGWSRFKWEDLEGIEKQVVDITRDKRIDIKGRMLLKKGKKTRIARYGTVTYFNTKDGTPETIVTSTDTDGKFVIENTTLKDKVPFILKGISEKGKTSVLFELDTTLWDVATADTYREVAFNEPSQTDDLPAIANADDTDPIKVSFITKDNKDFLSTLQILETVVVEAERITPKRTSIYGSPSKTLELTPIVQEYGGTNIFRFLKGRMAGVLITDNDLATTIQIRNTITTTASVGEGTDGLSGFIGTNPQNPLLFLDNVPVALEVIINLPSNIIERVEVFRGPDAAIFGSNASNGAMLFFTKLGENLNSHTKALGIEKFALPGYHITREFYEPLYDVNYQDTGVPDYRPALHWEPNIKTDKNGEAMVSFYNSDDTDTVKIMLEGLSFKGLPGFGSCQYQVINHE